MPQHYRKIPLECPVPQGEECLMPDQRKWSVERTINLPSMLAVVGLAITLTGVLILNDRRQTVAEEQIKLQAVVSKGIADHAAAVEQLAIRDRAEMRDDLKEIKETVNSIAVIQKRR